MERIFRYFIIIMCLNIFVFGICVAQEHIDNKSATGLDGVKVLDLKAAGQIALKDNPSIPVARARVAQALERIKQVRSGYWPRLDLTGSFSQVDMSDNDYNTNTVLGAQIENPENYYNAGLRATWLLFDGFERKFSSAVARYGKTMNDEACRDVNRLLLSSVTNAYFNAQLARENIEIAKADKAFYQRQLVEAKARYAAGTGSLADALNFEVRANSSQVELINAEKVYEASMYSLAALLGVPGARFNDNLELKKLESEKLDELSPLYAAAQIEYAMTHRPDLLQNDYAVKMAVSKVRSTRAGFYPTLNLIASIDGDRAEDSSFEKEDFGNTITLNLNYNIFAGGINKAKLKESKSVHIEAEKNFENKKLIVISEVRGSIAKLESARKQLAIQRLNANLVKQNRDLVETEYAAGQGSLVRLNEAQRDLTTARSRLVLALVSLRQTRFRLATDTGRILEIFKK